MLLGAHVSTAGGLPTAFERAEEVGCRSMQIFTKSKGAWAAKALAQDDLDAFRARHAASSVECVVAHAAYLLNVASPSTETRERSIGALRIELERCEALGIVYLVLHPGSHMGEGERAGLRRVARALDRVHRETSGFRSRILLETSAGQGSSVCCRFESIATVLGDVRDPGRLGACVDTCHVFAAGYELRDDEGYSRTLEELHRHVGLETVRCLHLNDSKRELGSRVDRHDHIGRGRLGKPVFGRVLNDPRLQGRPMIIELPPDDGMLRKNLDVLRRLVSKTRTRLSAGFHKSLCIPPAPSSALCVTLPQRPLRGRLRPRALMANEFARRNNHKNLRKPALSRAKSGRSGHRPPGTRAPGASPRPRRGDRPR